MFVTELWCFSLVLFEKLFLVKPLQNAHNLTQSLLIPRIDLQKLLDPCKHHPENFRLPFWLWLLPWQLTQRLYDHSDISAVNEHAHHLEYL